eukprot:scaffold384794_cov33-Prasinocladus_malaysianus.AAC.1
MSQAAGPHLLACRSRALAVLPLSLMRPLFDTVAIGHGSPRELVLVVIFDQRLQHQGKAPPGARPHGRAGVGQARRQPLEALQRLRLRGGVPWPGLQQGPPDGPDGPQAQLPGRGRIRGGSGAAGVVAGSLRTIISILGDNNIGPAL